MKRIIKRTTKAMAVTAIACIAILAATRNSAVSAVTAADAAATYKGKCASCHGADGGGQTAAGKAMKVRDLRSAEVQGQSDDQLYAAIAKGKGKMPGYEKSLGAETCKALVAYIRQLK
jgi:mono/diheme cytochrome c family protein